MKRRLPLLPSIALVFASLACILQMDTGATLSPQQIESLAAQTMIFLQWQTYSAQGTQAPSPAPNTQAPPPAAADTATYTMLPSVTAAPTISPTATLTPLPCNWTQFITDINYPDDTEVGLSDHFTKTWQLKNIGSCTWTSGYSLVFDHGDQMGAPAAQQLTAGTVAPGQTINISVDLVSPATPGTYQGYFKLRASDNSIFGIGAHADGAFWVKVKAVAGGFSVQQLEAQTTIAMGSSGTISVNCPSGTILVGGGFDGGNNISAHRNERIGNGWIVSGHRYSGANAALKAYAYCLSGVTGSSTSGYTEKTLASGLSGDATYNCTGGSVISGAGYGFNEGLFWPYVLRMEGNGLKMFAQNISGSSATFRSHPVCLTSPGAATVQAVNTGSVPGSSSGTVEAACPAGTTVTGGGFTVSTNMTVTGLYKKPGENNWVAKALNQNGSSMNMVSRAICLAIS
jgi:hypothetical protein